MVDRETGWCCGRLLCEMLPAVVGLTSVPPYDASASTTAAVRVDRPVALSPFDGDNLPEDPPPVTYRLDAAFDPIVTTASSGFYRTVLWFPGQRPA